MHVYGHHKQTNDKKETKRKSLLGHFIKTR